MHLHSVVVIMLILQPRDKDEHSQTSYFVYLMGIMADEEACQIIPREWSLRDTLKALRGFRDWLILV